LEITKLKQQPGRNINVSGSTTLVTWLLRQGLLDELDLLVFPLVVGHGKRLFEGEGDRVVVTVDEGALIHRRRIFEHGDRSPPHLRIRCPPGRAPHLQRIGIVRRDGGITRYWEGVDLREPSPTAPNRKRPPPDAD